jgi:hypothetical protein
MRHGRGHPGVFPPEVRAQVTATACQLPRQQDVPLARWSRAELARRIAAAHSHCPVSPSTVGRWLRAERLRPWRYRMWQHIHDPATFLARARPVLNAYAHARTMLTQGTWVVCVDEKTSIQAREAVMAPDPPTAGAPMRQSPRYHRRGARQLMAGWSVADGQVIGCCTERKRFVDFQHFLTTVLLPEAIRRQVQTVVLILDNGPTHAPKQLAAWLQAQNWPVTVQILWLPPNASWLDQIEIWFSVLQRKLLTPNHFASAEALEQAIAAFIAAHNAQARPITWTYTSDKLEKKLGSHL